MVAPGQGPPGTPRLGGTATGAAPSMAASPREGSPPGHGGGHEPCRGGSRDTALAPGRGTVSPIDRVLGGRTRDRCGATEGGHPRGSSPKGCRGRGGRPLARTRPASADRVPSLQPGRTRARALSPPARPSRRRPRRLPARTALPESASRTPRARPGRPSGCDEPFRTLGTSPPSRPTNVRPGLPDGAPRGPGGPLPKVRPSLRVPADVGGALDRPISI